MEIFTDDSGKPVGPILGVQETKSFGFFDLSRNIGKKLPLLAAFSVLIDFSAGA
jgi:hypothetical protein